MKKTISTILITPISNIINNTVVDNSKVIKRTHDSNMDVFTFYNVRNEETRCANLMSVSLYDDLIVEGEEKYKILHMLTKPAELNKC